MKAKSAKEESRPFVTDIQELPTTRTMMERIMANEEEHAEDMKTLLESLGKEEHFSDHS